MKNEKWIFMKIWIKIGKNKNIIKKKKKFKKKCTQQESRNFQAAKGT